MNGASNLHNTVSTWRIFSFVVLIVVVFIIYLVRLFSMQVFEYAEWLAQAEENRTQEINIPAPRGIIYDRNGIILARNVASYNVVITYADLPDDPGEVQKIFRELAPLIGVPVSNSNLVDEPYDPCISSHGIIQIAEYGKTSYPYSPVKVACDIGETIAMIVRERAVDWPGVAIEVVSVRAYPTGGLTASIVGYLGPISAQNEQYYTALGFVANRDKVGYAGIERTYQSILAGHNGLRIVERDIAGKVLRDLVEPVAPVPGNNVYLTIDTRLQMAAETIMEDELFLWNSYFGELRMTSGVAIAVNPQTGEVLAMVSYPSYENNRMTPFIPSYYYQQLVADERKPLLNHAVGDELPAGSVFKLVTAVGALNEGIVSPSQVIDTPGELIVQERAAPGAPTTERRFVDWNWEAGGFGQLDFIHAVANSSNVYFYKLGGGYRNEVPEGLGICRLGAYARALGYGEYPGTDLPEEEDGLIPDPEYKRISGGESWTLGDTYIVSVGQGYVLATPLQILLSAATIANDGILVNPTLVREVSDSDGKIVQPFVPDIRWNLVTDAIVEMFEPEFGLTGCVPTGDFRTIGAWVFDTIQEGMRLAVTEGTLSSSNKVGFDRLNIAIAGKTGTAEYCDQWAIERRGGRLCDFGDWPSHAWTVAYAPYENPEIAVVVFVYNGGEGASTAAPIVRRIMQAYFELRAIDNAAGAP